MVNNIGSILIHYLVILILYNGATDAAQTDEQMKADFTKLLLKCASKYKANMKDIMSLATLQTPTDPQVKCILACSYRELGTMNEKGLYDLEGANKLAEELQKGDDKRLEKAKQLSKLCSMVNNETVSDGEKGCDRAALIFACSVKNAPKFGFKV